MLSESCLATQTKKKSERFSLKELQIFKKIEERTRMRLRRICQDSAQNRNYLRKCEQHISPWRRHGNLAIHPGSMCWWTPPCTLKNVLVWWCVPLHLWVHSLFYPHSFWSTLAPCTSLSMPGMFHLQGLYTGCFFCLEFSSFRYP